MSRFSILSKQDIETLHEATLNLMEDYGVCVFGKEAQEILSGAGCEVDRLTGRVKFPRNLVNDCIQSAPAKFSFYGRPTKENPEGKPRDSGSSATFTTFGTGVMVIDPYTGIRRESTLHDLAEITRFADAIPEVDMITLPVAAQDVTEEIKELYEAEALYANTIKSVAPSAESGENTKRVLRIAAAVSGGAEALRKRPTLSIGTCPNSPLEIHESATELIIETVKAGVPCCVLSMGLAGGTTPVTLAGTLLVTNCEILAGIVLGQVTNKGTPMVYGTSTTIMDLKLMTSPVGAPEHAMISAAVTELGLYYGIPTDVGGT